MATTGFEIPWLQFLVGGLLFWFPGLTWTWALAPTLSWPQRLPVSLVAAFTIEPGFMMALNLLFGVPIRLDTTAYLAAALGMGGITLWLFRVRERFEPKNA